MEIRSFYKEVVWYMFYKITSHFIGQDQLEKLFLILISETNLSKNNIEWTLEKIINKRNNLVVFSSKNSMKSRLKGVCEENEFINEVVVSAHDYLTLREKDTRTQNLNEMVEKYNQLKQLIKE